MTTADTMITDEDVDRVARALGGAPAQAYTTPIVYPWAVQHFASRPSAERPQPPAGAQRLYVHIPFCRYHCTFCFYAVRTGAQRSEMERYVAALRRELEWVPAGTPLARLIVGGGTPTALPPELLADVLDAVAERMPSTAESAHTLEASPDSLTEAHLRVLHEHGIGRVSVGIESTSETVLGAVQRRHTTDEALTACRMVKHAGLTLNVDLIYGLPGQSQDSFRRDVETVARTGAETVCVYGLRLNERTAVGGQLAPAERLDDLARVMQWRAFVRRAAEAAGFVQTRCYTFKRASETRSWHERGPSTPANGVATELAVGMAARAQLGDAVYRNHENAEIYMQRVEQGLSPVETVFDLDTSDRQTQFVASRLGNGWPLDRAAYEAAFGTTLDADFDGQLTPLIEGELIDDNGTRIVLTDTGRLVYDRILLCLYPKRSRDWLATRRVRHGRG